MTTPEEDRIAEIDRRLLRLKRRHDKLYVAWLQLNQERQELAETIRMLNEEREDLAQGQLLFEELSN